jgi:hypothetical protein
MTTSQHTTPRAATDISPKVTGAALGAAAATIALWIVEAATGIDVPAMVEGAVAVVFVFGTGYLVPDNR